MSSRKKSTCSQRAALTASSSRASSRAMKFRWPGARILMMMSGGLALLMGQTGRAQEVARVTSAVTFSSKGTVSSGATKPTTETLSGSTASTVKAAVTQPAALDPVQPGGKLSTGADGATSLILGTTGTARMGADTEIQIPDDKTKEHSLEMLKGKLYLNISAEELAKRKAGEFRLKTPTALLAVKGTKFFAISDNGTDTIGVHEGSVVVYEPVSKTIINVPAP